MKKIIIPIILLFAASLYSQAQEKSDKETRGDKYVFNYSYDKAIDMYTKADPLSIEGQRNLAKSYSNLDSNAQAEAIYSQITMSSGVQPDDYYNYAVILKTNGKYAESDRAMDQFAASKPSDLRAQSYLAGKNDLTTLQTDVGRYRITHMDINTDGADFGPAYYKNQLAYVSSRAKPAMIMHKDNWHRKPYLDMYIGEIDGNQLKDVQQLSKVLNGRMHDGPASFSNNDSFIAFTRNNYTDKSADRVVELQIAFSRLEDGKWQEPQAFAYNSIHYSNGHPSLTSDGNTLYFSSNMPGGFGGADIYKSTKDAAGSWSKPENLGNLINTEGDELFPFVQDKKQILLFSSNGRFGLGGFDLFICELKGATFGRIFNAGYPLNSQYDDFGAVVNSTMTKGYFSSNRKGGTGDDDLYAFDILKGFDIRKKIEGFAKEVNGKVIPSTSVVLYDEQNNVLDSITTPVNGSFTFYAENEKNYRLIGSKINFNNGEVAANTYGKEEIVKVDIILTKKVIPIVEKIKENADLAEILELNAIYFDLDKSNIREDARIELDKIIIIMNEYPQMVVSLKSYTDCRASDAYNQKLSERRALSTTNYIKRKITKPSRITGAGLGETKISSTCACEDDALTHCSETDYQLQRNTEFLIVKK
ncbi:MAG: OmpA family protein [Bacteroidota bacterium]